MRKVILIAVLVGLYADVSSQVVSGLMGKRAMVDLGIVVSQAPKKGVMKMKYNVGVNYIVNNYATIDIGVGFESNKHEAMDLESSFSFGDNSNNLYGSSSEIGNEYIYDEFTFNIGKTWYSKSRGDLAPFGYNGGLGLYVKNIKVDYSRLTLKQYIISSVTGEKEASFTDFGVYAQGRKNYVLSDNVVIHFGLKTQIPLWFVTRFVGVTEDEWEPNEDETLDFFHSETLWRNLLQLEIGVKYAL